MDGNGDPEPNVRFPSESLSEIPYDLYTDTALYKKELEEIYRGPVWNYLCLAAELPNLGDYQTSSVGETPVIVTRDKDGVIHAMENRCSHRGALVCLKRRGNAKVLTCVYHSWSYDLDGGLRGVAFEKGVNGQGGVSDSFDKKMYGLRRIRVTEFCGLIFGTYSDATPDFETYVGPEIAGYMRSILDKPLTFLGRNVQVLPNNWKIYNENLRDSYHASLLHTFFNTFKLNRLSQEGGIVVGAGGGSHISYGKSKTGYDHEAYQAEGIHSLKDMKLADPTLLDAVDESGEGMTTRIMSVFPSFGLQCHYNSIAIRQVLPKGVAETELVWNHVGYVDDDADMRARRLKQSNLVGPAGYISMEDGCIGGFVQKAIQGVTGEVGIVPMGGDTVESTTARATEVSIRGFWKAYRAIMGM
ncbi:MAG: aromatic ring-hydroxylating oxygenase subunit alpha [Alphaproteobacteria bacterium]